MFSEEYFLQQRKLSRTEKKFKSTFVSAIVSQNNELASLNGMWEAVKKEVQSLKQFFHLYFSGWINAQISKVLYVSQIFLGF